MELLLKGQFENLEIVLFKKIPRKNIEGNVPESFECQIKYRPNEEYWIQTNKTTLNVIFSMDFMDPVDQGLARILLLVFFLLFRRTQPLKGIP